MFIFILSLYAGCSLSEKGENADYAGRLPTIQPDYSGIVIPPNIAPLNFSVQEAGEEYIVQIHSAHGEPIRIQNSSGRIEISPEHWKRLLAENLGQQLIMEVSVNKQDGHWIRFDSVVNQIAYETADSYIAYRRLGPIFNQWKNMGIFQRCLEDFTEKPIFLNRLTQKNCMNCHNFWQNKPDRWLMHFRYKPGTCMVLMIDGEIRKIDTRTEFNKRPAAYPSWHPSGELIAFSAGPPFQFFHTIGETREELDRSSDIILYDIPTNTITTTNQISSPEFIEIWPAWSSDGRYLYFCSVPKIETFTAKSITNDDSLAYDKIKYDLMRIAYNPENHTWGKLETVLSSAGLGLSITEPKVSPDGKFLVFTAAEYSSFPIFRKGADLYLLDLLSGQYKRMELNSNRAEGYHSWSSNSRWIVFSSKREDGQFNRIYLSHIDSLGNASKAFILPQKDPSFYDAFLEIYNVPEFIKEPVRVSPQNLAKILLSQEKALSGILDPAVIRDKNLDKAKSDAQIQMPQK